MQNSIDSQLAHTTLTLPTVKKVAKAFQYSPAEIILNYRDAAYSAFHALEFSRIEMIRFVRECLAIRHPLIQGRAQYDLAVEVLKAENLID